MILVLLVPHQLNSRSLSSQFHHILVPPAADPHGHWYHCKLSPKACNAVQIATLQGFSPFVHIITSCIHQINEKLM